MRKTLLLLFQIASLTSFSQVSLRYNFSKPLGEQGKQIQQAHGLDFVIDRRIRHSPFLLEFDFANNIYGLKTVKQDLTGHDGHITTTKVHYSTYFFNYSGGVKYRPAEKKNIMPYGTFTVGLISYRAHMVVDDPNDPLGCKPLENKMLLQSVTWSAQTGAGMDFNWKAIKPKSTSHLQLNVGVFYTFGGPADYLKITKSSDPVDPKGRQYYAKFESIPTGEIHDHPIGKVYNTFTSMLVVKIGVNMLID